MEKTQTSSESATKFRDIETRGIKMKRKPMFDQTHTTLLNGIQLGFEKGFGFNQDKQINNNAYCIDDNRIIYILASQIVLYDMLAETQKIIASFDYQEEIGAMNYFKNIMLEDNIVYSVHSSSKSFPSLIMHNFTKNLSNKFMLANLQKEEKISQIVLFNDFRNIAVISIFDKFFRLTIIETSSKEIQLSQFLNFQPIGLLSIIQASNKLILYGSTEIYTVQIDGQLKLQSLSAKKQLCQNDENIVQIAVSLNIDLCLYCITNKGYLYFFDIDLKENKLIKSQRIFLGTFRTLNSCGQQIQIPRKPSGICANEYNILIGYELLEQFTLVKIYAVSTQLPSLEPIKFCCPYLHKILRMNFAAQTMAICVTVQVKENDKYDLSIPINSNFFKDRNQDKVIKQNLNNHKLQPGKIFPIIFNLLLYDTLVETLRSPIQTILNPMLLTKKILDICVLPTKRLIVVLSADKRIKAIKYENISSTSFQKMLAWEMIFNQNDQIASLDVHPLIFTVAVGFKQGIKLFTMFSNGIKPTNIHFPLKNCECVKYSKFGQSLVAGSSSQIILINPYQNRIISSFQLSYSFNVKELKFIDQDMYLFAAFTNGSSQIMNLQGNKVFQVWNKNCKCIASCYDPIFDIMVMSYEDNEVKFYREKGQMQFAIMWTFPFVITKILVVNQLGTAFMGTSTGKIRAYQWPFTDMVKFSKSYTEIQLHRSAVNQIKIGHDFSYLISGCDEGSVFITKISAYSDGILVSDSSVLHTFKVNKKNYTSLYYLQNLACTNNSRQSQKQQQIIQYELDKVDFETDENYILQNLKQQIEQKLQEEQKNRKQKFKTEINPYEETIENLNIKKLQIKQQINKLLKQQQKQRQQKQQNKLKQMRKLYKQSDHLKIKLAFYHSLYKEQIKKQQQKYENQYQIQYNILKEKQDNLIRDCDQLQKDYEQSKINYRQLLKEQQQQGKIYKKKMIQNLQNQYAQTKQRGQQLRKVMNKINHDIHTVEDKSKFFSSQITEISLDIQNNLKKQQSLLNQVEYLGKVLIEKDQQIFDEQKAVKELLKKSITNYTHEEYLKHKQDQLIAKAKYLQKQIQNLDEKYMSFQQNFIDATKQSNQNMEKIENSYHKIQTLKRDLATLKQTNYMKKYKFSDIYAEVLQEFHACNSKKVLSQNIAKILQKQNQIQNKDKTHSNISDQITDKIKPNVDKRDHLIDQVINNNKLRKIDDTIRRTIMVKLNRETVNLTGEVNQLRKQKKKLSIKSRDLCKSIQLILKQLNIETTHNKQNSIASLNDIVPQNADISVIKSHNSKYVQNSLASGNPKPLPFQIYHANKFSSQRNKSQHSLIKQNAKSLTDENSTQLPSIIKSNNPNNSYSGSILEQTNLSGVEQIDDQMI